MVLYIFLRIIWGDAMSNKHILKLPWQSKSGIQEDLYLGYNDNNKLDYIVDLPRAKVMTEEECKEWLLILKNSKRMVIDTLPEEFNEEETKSTEENTNEQSTDN